jgi:PAS domain S-box-containing protein
VRALPSRSVILYSRQSHEDPDRVLQAFDFLGPVSQAASVPVYAPWRSHLGAGVVGGVVDDPVAGATNAAEMVLRVARGARPEDVPTGRVPTSPAFDARQLARFGIAEDELPPGSTVLFREPTVWSRYWPYVLGTFVVVGLQALLIGALLFQRARRRRVESALRESEERFRVMADTAPVLIWRSNTTKACDFFNSPWLEFRGRSLEEESGWGWSLGIHPDDRDEYVATYSSAFDRRGPFSVESRLQRADGEYRWVMCTGIPRLTGDGSFAGYIGSVVDITDRKRAELNLETTRHELARVARVTSLAQCAAHTAHELSQPLASIQMNVGACLRWLKGPSVPTNELHGALLDAATAASMASGIIAREREMFRRHSVEKQALDANGIATEVVSLLRARLEHTGTRLGLRLAPDLPPVRGNRVELQQVLLNLLLNGIEAMETVGQADRRLTIETRLAGDMVQTTVEDTGPGVRDADVEHLFKPFSTTKPSGTGIGLSISRLIVEHHDGSIWVDRNSSRGARFHFTVPVAAEEVTGPVAGAATRRSPQEAPGRAARAS